ncbi:MAG: hypothetical protein JTJ20_06505 [Blautia sp.]|nr:hypothetical protein [Blautia sp.]
MNDLRSLKQDERMEEMLEVLESMEQELAQKDTILQKKDSEIQILQGQLNESLNLCEKLNSENAYSARTAHPFRRNGAPFRFKLSKAQQVD